MAIARVKRLSLERLESRIAMAVVNASFEEGLTAWTSAPASGGGVNAVTTHQAITDGSVGRSFNAPAGSQFALLSPGGPGELTKLSQSFSAKAGSKIQGWAFFDAGDYLPFDDFGEVSIRSSDGASVKLFSSSVGSVGDYGETDWVPWEYTFNNDGTYTIEATVSNRLDSVLDSFLGLDIAAGTDLAVQFKPVVPKLATDLQLGHFLSKEALNFPVVIQNSGGTDIKGKVDVKIYLSTTKDLEGKVGTEPLVKKEGIEIDLAPSKKHELTLDGEVSATMAGLLTKGSDYYFVAEATSSTINEAQVDLKNNVSATESSSKFAGPLSSLVAVNAFYPKYYKVIRDTLNSHDPFASQGAPAPTNGKEFTAAFETSGGYSSPDLSPYLDSKGIATIGIGINLEATQKADVTTALVTAVKDFYRTQAEAGVAGYDNIDGLSAKQVISMLVTQAKTNTALQALTVADAQAVYDIRYGHSETSAKNYVGEANWASVPDKAKWLLVDIDFNLGSLSKFPSMVANVKSSAFLLAAYEFLNAKRTQDVQTDRTVAGLQALLGKDYTKLGKIV